jgi:hypothetical protein
MNSIINGGKSAAHYGDRHGNRLLTFTIYPKHKMSYSKAFTS